MMKDRSNRRALECQEYVEALLPALRYCAYRCGYAIAVHGSLARDIDLVACPWRDSAISAGSLVSNLLEVVQSVVGIARFREIDTNPIQKPAGRLAWAVYLTTSDEGPYLDISVMPIGGEVK